MNKRQNALIIILTAIVLILLATMADGQVVGYGIYKVIEDEGSPYSKSNIGDTTVYYYRGYRTHFDLYFINNRVVRHTMKVSYLRAWSDARYIRKNWRKLDEYYYVSGICKCYINKRIIDCKKVDF